MKAFTLLAIFMIAILNAAQLPQKGSRDNIELTQTSSNSTDGFVAKASASIEKFEKIAAADMKPSATIEKRETKVYHFVGLSMSQEELTWYLVIFGIILIILVAVCFIF